MPDLTALPPIPDDAPILIAGPTASGKSALALELADRFGGMIVNADASQVFDCWRILTARPSEHEEARADHRLYGHQPYDALYSAGHWLREVTPLLNGPKRPIIVGGTGLYFMTLTRGLADIPATPPDIRADGDERDLSTLLAELDAETTARIDTHNRARVQRAWEVLRATGRPLSEWQKDTPPPVLPLSHSVPLVVDAPKDWLLVRIVRRFDRMVEQGAIDEIAAMQDRYDPALPSCKAIGAPELMRYVSGSCSLDEAREAAHISTRQFAKRQRTWFRSKMRDWHHFTPV
ncbi:MAG: tRNA (adenosine(37)-N6)-dimethylallyltransferase MiaA [Rhodobacteraceae bacterium]|nr:tRNA (adenosine(37)-N6)-dimethylallyltransferase MiaA [Paracoccaceae bacterium]